MPSVVSNSDDYDVKLKKLQEQILTKDGEVSILRSQLNALKTRYESENARKQKEWVKTLNEKTKEIETIQSKLEFKVCKYVTLIWVEGNCILFAGFGDNQFKAKKH